MVIKHYLPRSLWRKCKFFSKNKLIYLILRILSIFGVLPPANTVIGARPRTAVSWQENGLYVKREPVGRQWRCAMAGMMVRRWRC
ncbi:MAG TPA: hypothetical protein DEP05_09755 [Betaproteobacteria bacterium]|nr:hypothetical protein [Betaproteobacteria bacterium]